MSSQSTLRTERPSDAADAAAAIDVRHLVKRFGDVVAVDDITFAIPPGEVFAFLGPNGAGKSTAINMLCTLTRPTSGQATVAGFDVRLDAAQVRSHIGLVFQETTLDKQLTAEENLRFHAVLYHVPRREREERISRALDLVELGGRRRDLVATFSGGMARRLEIARAMLHTPKVLFLDEPTIGLDPQTRKTMWDGILALRRESSLTVFLTTHYMDEAEVADRIGIIDNGRIAVLDTPANLKATAGSETVQLHTSDDERALLAITAAGYAATAQPGYLTVATANAETQIPLLIAAIGGGVTFVSLHEPTLDDAFLHFTGRQIRDEATEQNAGLPRAWRNRR